MTPAGQTICLAMIVKNEAPVIRRCLASVRPLIDHWIVVDTGSTDGTQELVREALADLPGHLMERPWVDFGHNRSEALALARGHGTYSLIIDADDELILPPGFILPTLTAEGYDFTIAYGSITYQRTQLVSNALAWHYRGVLHEFIACPEPHERARMDLIMRPRQDGARRRDGETYRRDAAILEAALATETDPFLIARYTFYLGQSYRDCGTKREAIATFMKRVELGFWQDEVYLALTNAADLMADLGDPAEAVLAIYDRAIALCPGRAEARHKASLYCRRAERYDEGFRYAEAGLSLTAPEAGLFVESWIYAYGLKDEYAVNAYWAGHYWHCLAACLDLLACPTAPEAERPRFAANARYALEKMPPPLDARRGFLSFAAPAMTPQTLSSHWASPLPPMNGVQSRPQGATT